MRKTSAFLITVLLIISAFFSGMAFKVAKVGAQPTTRSVPNPYPTIQAAINAAVDGDIVTVAPDIYFEHIVVNKAVSLIGENKENTIIDGNGKGPVISVTADNVVVNGFTIQNASETGILSAGLFVGAVTGVNITGNIVQKNWIGIYLTGSNDNIIKENLIVNNTYGVYLSQSGQNNFDHNTALDNRWGFFLSLDGSARNVLRNNNLSRNSQNFKLITSFEVSNFVQDIDSSNTVDGKPIYYWVNQRDRQVPTDAGYVAIINSTNITVKDSVLSRNGEGILLAFTNNSTIDNVNASNIVGILGNGVFLYYSNNNYILRSMISNNTGAGILLDTSESNIILGNMVTNDTKGIELSESINNVIYGNVISNSRGFGIDAFYSINNTIYHNNFVANAVQVSTRNSTNSWDDGYPSGGNYWSDYTSRYPGAKELETSGLWDTPYVIDANNTDRYPLMNSPPLVPAFVISVAPFSRYVEPGQSVTYTVTLVSANSFSSEVQLNVTLTPTSNNITFSFDPETIVPPPNGLNQSVLTVTALSEATPATFVIKVNATYASYYATDSIKVTVLDIVKPIADAGPDQTVNQDTVVTLDGSGSSDNVGIANYTWTFFDARLQTLTGVNPVYNFTYPGEFVVSLNVTDAAGNWATDNVTITVLDIMKPVAKAGQNQTVQLGTPATFDGSGSTDNVGIVRYEWNFGDGSDGNGAIIRHTYSNTGTYNVTLTVFDAADNSDTDSVTVTVTAPPSGSYLLILAAAGAAVAIGIGLAVFFWRRRKQMPSKPVSLGTVNAFQPVVNGHGIVRQCTLFFTKSRIIVASPPKGVTSWMIVTVIVAFAVSFVGLLLKNFALFLGALGVGIAASLLMVIADSLIRHEQLNKMRRLSPEQILKMNRENFEISYAEVAKAEVKSFETYPKGSYFHFSLRENQYTIDFVARDDKKHTFILDGSNLAQCLDLLHEFAPDIIKIEEI